MAPPDDLLAAALPGYEIGDELGRGAWGVVIAGRHRALGREVAIKQLGVHVGREPDVLARFLAEAQVLGRFDHPHIVRVYDFVEYEGECLLVMEKLTGGTASERMREGGLTPSGACGWIVALCAGLSYAHERQVLHRDVKPENMMFSGDGVLKVTDFGIAKVLSGSTATRSGLVMGTPAYIAPEQASGSPVTPATDVYAAGTVLYELLAGRLPYDPAESPLAALYQRVNQDHVPLLELAPDIPEPIAEVVDRSLSRNPDKRYLRADTMALALSSAAEDVWARDWTQELEAVLRTPLPGAGSKTVIRTRATAEVVPVGAGPPAELPPPPPTRRLRRGLVAGIGLAGALVAVAAVLILGGGDDGLGGLPALPPGWPHQLITGIEFSGQIDPENAQKLRDSTGVATQGYTASMGWKSYDRSGKWAQNATSDAVRAGLIPFVSYYTIDVLKGSGAKLGDEGAKQRANLADRPTMRRYWADVSDFLRQLAHGARGRPVALNVEPILWPIQELHGPRSAKTVKAIVGSSGASALKGLPDDLSGFARAWVRLRDRLAPKIALGFATAEFGSGVTVAIDDQTDHKIAATAGRGGAFYRSLGAKFDFASLLLGDYDAGYGRVVRHDRGRSMWTTDDYRRHIRWVDDWVKSAGLRVVLIGVSMGNTRMRAENDTRFHYQDNHVERLLGEPHLERLRAYRKAGVIGIIFGLGRHDATCACDASGDGITNPKPVAGNLGLRSVSEDDDGGYLRQQTRRYADAGHLGL